ncbi:MAG: M20/M25/M40 family metallo-hydrolase [Acidimicrobiia bacterium]|nr:M20/M25/M40 family metallo-hydrolase [Acidimicrobiia bacterium]
MTGRSRTILVVIALVVSSLPMIASAGDPACDKRTNNTINKLLECVTLDGVRAHQEAFQAAADANGDIRATGTPGYDATVAYVVETLEAAGYDVELNEFPFTYVALPELTQLAPITADYETGSFSGTGFGEVVGNVIPVDLALGNADWPADPSTSSSGCEATDFDGLDFSGPNDIALTQRGTCFFSVKAVNAQAAGAEAIIIFNQGSSPTRLGPVSGNATALPDGSPSNIVIPMAGASFDAGIALSAAGSQARVSVDPPDETIQYNVIAELPGQDDRNVVMAGAHLDSVQQGPGVQDNGSGSAAILETAVQMAKVKPENTVRFAWWGAEESGLIGSTAYVNGLSQEEIDDIALYLNFDMIGSPNFVYFIYDGDDSDGVGAGPGPEGSAQIEDFYEEFYEARGLPYKGTDFSGRSDYGPFIAVGIPAGGLFTGAEGVKTDAEAAIWGGTAGEQYDPCYHLACDTFDNISLEALDVNSDAVAASVLSYGMNTELVNGEKGKGNFKPQNQRFHPNN